MAPSPLTFRDAFDLSFPVTVLGMRMDTVDGPCRVGVQLRRTSSFQSRPTFELWAYATNIEERATTPCSAFTTSAARTTPMVRAVAELAGLAAEPIAIEINLAATRPALERYLAAVATLPADADEAQVAAHTFAQDVYASWQPFVDGLGYRVTGVELFRLEPRGELGSLTEQELRTLVATGPYPPRLPVRASLLVEPAGTPTAIGKRAPPRTLANLYALSFDVAISELDVRAELGACAPQMSLGSTSLRVDVTAATCAGALERDLPALFHAGRELIAANPDAQLTIATAFATLPVLEKWVPVIRSPAWTKQRKQGAGNYELMTKLMKEHGVFAHLDPFFTALGYRLSRVSIEKVSMEPGNDLLREFPSLASTGLTAKDRIPIPLMLWLVLER